MLEKYFIILVKEAVAKNYYLEEKSLRKYYKRLKKKTEK